MASSKKRPLPSEENIGLPNLLETELCSICNSKSDAKFPRKYYFYPPPGTNIGKNDIYGMLCCIFPDISGKVPPKTLQNGFACRTCHCKVKTLYDRAAHLKDMIIRNLLKTTSSVRATTVTIPGPDNITGSPTPKKHTKKRKLSRTPLSSPRVLKFSSRSPMKHAKKQIHSSDKVRPDPVTEQMQSVALKQVEREVRAYCLVANHTLLRSKDASILSQFSWQSVGNELTAYMPFVMNIMMSIIRTDAKSNKNTKHQLAIAAFVLSVMLKERNQNMSAAQVVLSLLLALGHIDSVTFKRMQHLNITVSPVHCMELLRKVGERSSDEVVSWIRRQEIFSIVGDNVDGIKRVRRMRVDRKNEDWHWFNAIAVMDRVAFATNNEEANLHNAKACLEDMAPSMWLPSLEDNVSLRSHMIIIAARIMQERMPELQPYLDLPQHIPHRYQKQMSQRSKAVALEVELKNPNKLSEMIQIMRTLDTWKERICAEANDDTTGSVPTPHTVLWGDQLTRVRAQSAKQLSNEGATPKERLESITPAVQDWHAKMHLYEVWYKRHMKEKSAGERGTVKYLQNAIRRYNLPSAPKANMNAVQDFIHTITKSHILAAALQFFGMESLTSLPTKNFQPPTPCVSKEDQTRFLNETIGKFVDLYVMPGEEESTTDHVFAYHCSLLHMGVFLAEFEDAIKEGDGDRVIRDWKFMLLFFKSHGNTNYSVEAFNLLAQVQATLPPLIRQQVRHNRFFNSRGGAGGNKTLDLQMEHENRKLKKVFNSMAGNVTETNVKRVSKAAPFIGRLEKQYEKEAKASRRGKVRVIDSHKDEDILIKELQRAEAFSNTAGRQYNDFEGFSRNPFSSLSGSVVNKWLKEQKKKMMRNLTS